MSSYSSISAESTSTCSDSHSSMSTTSSDSVSPTKKLSCFFDSSTCQRQNFSIPEKIVYYLAKNATNAKTFKKLVQTCKYFFVINPVIVVYRLECYRHGWDACYDVKGKYNVGFKYDQPINFKIWVTHDIDSVSGNASKLIPFIYKNDATYVDLQNGPFLFEDFLFLVGNAKELSMVKQLVKYKNGEIVQLEDIVKNLPKLKKLDFEPRSDGSDADSNTVRKLMEIEHFKNVSKLEFCNISENFNVEEMFNLIIENKHIKVELWYRSGISGAYRELVQEYANLLRNENGCRSSIGFCGMDWGDIYEHQDPAFEDEISDTSFDSTEDDDVSSSDDNEDFLFPWKNEEDEEWELPWDKE